MLDGLVGLQPFGGLLQADLGLDQERSQFGWDGIGRAVAAIAEDDRCLQVVASLVGRMVRVSVPLVDASGFRWSGLRRPQGVALGRC
jgi:hypothetical protein